MTHPDEPDFSTYDQLFSQWVNAELRSLDFDAADAVLAQLDITDAASVSATASASSVMTLYHQTLAEQCPDYWPVLLTQLKQPSTLAPFLTPWRFARPAFYRAVASIVLLVGVTVYAWNGAKTKPAIALSVEMAVLPTLSNLDGSRFVNPLSPALVKPSVKTALATLPDRHLSLTNQPRISNRLNKTSRVIRHHAVKTARLTSPLNPINHTVQVERSILAAAQQVVERQQQQAVSAVPQKTTAPGAYDYVFNVSANSKDALVLDLSQ